MTATDPNSDYNTPSTDLFQLLPEPYQSDTNRSVYSNLFNRFLSKTETVHTVGYVGDGNPAAVVKRQIKEPTVHRQGYQLQPVMYDKIGSVEHISSWYDILNGLTAQGIDVSRQPDWASALEFNWVPPIDINKIVNFQDYYWYDPANPQSQPQYITVKSECSAAMALVSFYNSLIAQNGATFNILNVIPATSSIVIQGNYTLLFVAAFIFYIENTANVNLNNSFQQVVSSSFNASLNETTIVISNTFVDSTIGGDISLEQQLAIYEGIATCKCTGEAGWDTLPWDDNQANNPPPLWDAAVIADIAWPTLAAWNAVHGSPQEFNIWWDTTSDILYSLNVPNPTVVQANNIANWKVIYFNFSLIESQTTGTGYWDLSTGCANDAVIVGLDQWISQNRWVHKADVANFSIAKQAQVPIIEFEPNLELSEWTTTSYNWQYRTNSQAPFTSSTVQPSRFELEPLNIYTSTTSTITLDERFGDLTNVFVPGYKFLISGIVEQFSVVSSSFQRANIITPNPAYIAFNTVITVAEVLPVLVPITNYLYPELTSRGDPFTLYGNQWLFTGINTTTAINHQPEQQLMTPTVIGPTYAGYTTLLAPYAEEFDINATGVTTLTFDSYIGPNTTRDITQRALLGFDDVRVYVNKIRQYGTYDELGSVYVTGIQFMQPLSVGDVVLVQVGEATYQDFGNYAVPVRTILSDSEFNLIGPITISLVQLRLNEQVKTQTNQIPLFDIYNTDSTSAKIANPIFAYHESPTGVLYAFIGQRIVHAIDGSIEFQNYLVQSNNGPLYSYRNYNKSVDLYWYNTVTGQLLVWTGETWSAKYEASGIWATPVVAPTLPASPYLNQLAFNTTTNTLNKWTGAQWINVLVHIATSDETLETNWRHGKNNEQFIPARVDWVRRSFPEYTTEYNAYIATTSAELIAADPTLTPAEAQADANVLWTQIQDRSIVPAWYTDTTLPLAVRDGPLWIGNWQIPDPLYFNVEHQDWQYISLTDLLTHFTSIVNAQPSFPGFGGQASANWRLIDYTQINWGLGGTIKEYDNSFDTFLSSQFIDTVTPPSLFSFAQSEYENTIVILRDLLTRNIVTYMTDVDTSVILDPSAFAATEVLTSYEKNEAANLVYGDSTTYTQATPTTPASGVQNWIATLPFFGIVPKVAPYIFSDPHLGILGIMHHDGHRATYQIPQTIIVPLQAEIVNTPDPRAVPEKFGRIRTVQPPASQALFIAQFSSVLRNGVYWLVGPTLYRLAVANVGQTPPTIVVPDGSLWWDTTGTGTLRQQVTVGLVVTWPPAPGFVVGDGRLYDGATVQQSTISAWEIVNLNEIYLQVILNAETLLYNQVPPAPIVPPINFAGLEATYPTLFSEYLQQQFTNYTIELQIATPFVNNTFTASNPFTWNYKYSTVVTPPRVGTIPSGGTWQDVYEKGYGTPYPHLEPWILQGYADKPTWWDQLFAMPEGGPRRWRYVHGITVTSASNFIPYQFDLTGDVIDAFEGFDTFTLFLPDNISKQVFTIVSVALVGSNTVVTVVEPTNSSMAGGKIAVGMWDYVLRGATPAGQTPPLTPPTMYGYVSVNISDQTFQDGSHVYHPDDVFPPYWNYTAHLGVSPPAINVSIRSIFDSMAEIHLENADYLWEDAGPVEWQWRQTSNYLYSLVTVAYMIEPVRTIQSIFGTKFEFIDELPIDSLTSKVFSHTDTQFHGEITVNNQVVSVNGINQWYVNFNRANGFDTSSSDFRSLWTVWTAPLTYQFGSFVDTTSLSVDHRVVEITPSDYNITIKRSPGVANYWIDAFKVLITNVPPNFALYDTSSEWGLQLNSFAPISRTISYYDVQLYDFYADPKTSICSLYTYPIITVSSLQNSFTVEGDVSQVFGGLNGASQFSVTGSNAGTYTVVSCAYDPVLNQTVIVTSTSVPSSTGTGLLSAINYRTIPWNTGDLVSIASTGLAPLPLDLTLQYFVIKLSPTTFQLAYNSLDVTANIPILFTTVATGIQRVGTLYNTFTALNAAHAAPLWSHYQVDTTVVKQLTLPTNITGIQTFINIIDGYSAYVQAQGFGINVSGSYRDPATGQSVSWQNELERFIDWAYQQRAVRRQRMNDKYAVDLNYNTGAFTYTSQNPGYLVGTPVVVWSFQGGLPPPLLIGQTYYIINNNDGTISLASNFSNAVAGNAITISFIGGVGKLYISTAELYAAELPTYEVNPFRNALWFSPAYGIVSNIVVGPFADILSTQLIFDQYGRRLEQSDIRVFRQDKLTQIQYASGVYNDVQPLFNNQQNPYQYLHIGGANLYLDSYEHIMWFNDYTTAGALLYDPFLGLNVTKYELDFYKADTFTERPNVGGYFLSQPFNQGANILTNIEGSIENLRNVYDPYKIPETLPEVARARALIGYTGVSDYLSQINLNSKSQFLFYKGAIHSKGSINAVKAFVNSRRFINAQVDDFWAYKVADFGPVKVPEYISMLLTIADTQTNDLRLEFILTDQVCLPGYGIEAFGDTDCGYANPPNASFTFSNTDPTFTPILMSDQTRWLNQPNQLETLVPDGGVLYFNLKPKQKLVIYTTTLQVAPGGFNPFDPDNLADTTSPLYVANLVDGTGVIAFDPTNSILNPPILDQQQPYTFWIWNVATRSFVYAGGWNPLAAENNEPIFRHNFKADTVTATMNWYPDGADTVYAVPPTPLNVKELSLTLPYLPLTNSLTVFKNGIQLAVGIDYVESLELFLGSQILGYKLYFIDTISGSTINVVYGPSQLSQDTQFQIVNTNIISLLSQEFITNLFANNTTITLWGLEVDKESQNPAYIIDNASGVVLSPVTYWDPARGYHYYNALHSIDVQANTDPASYDSTNGGLNTVWKESQVGVTWMDTTNVDYLPYYDTTVLSNEETRFTDWGQLTDFGAVHIYQWTASSVPPDQYNAIAAVQEGDSSIDASIRYSGTVRQDVRYRNRVNTTATVTPSTSGFTTIALNRVTVSTDPTGFGPTTVYHFTINVDGFTRIQTYTGSQMTTFADLIRILTTQFAVYGATIALSGSNLIIKSNSVGVSSVVTITIDTFFAGLTVYVSNIATAGTPQQIVVANPALFSPTNTVLFSSTSTLPTGLAASTVYTISSVVGSVVTLAGVTITSAGSGTLTMGDSVWTNVWTLATQQRIDLDPSIDATFTVLGSIYTFAQNTTTFAPGTVANIYVNGKAIQLNYTLSTGLVFPTVVGGNTVLPSLNRYDRVTIIVPIPVPTTAQLAFNPAVADDGSQQIQYQFITNYIATQQFDVTTNSSAFTYYFWVENKTTPFNTMESISEAANDIIAPPAPYVFFGKLLFPALVLNTETGETIQEPFRFCQAIVRGLRGYVDDENRYVLRWTRDFTLRDELAFGTSSLQLKDAHQEWLMFREQQLSNIPIDLWNKITESMAGYLLTNTSTRVPALNRQLYDVSFGTSTQYGLGTGQAFVNGPTAIATILAYLTDPGNNFYPTDMDQFFSTFNFNTPANCVTTMNQIYDTFNYIHVNEMFFSVLLDALSVQTQYAGLMKTSAIALYGIELLDVAGAFDD